MGKTLGQRVIVQDNVNEMFPHREIITAQGILHVHIWKHLNGFVLVMARHTVLNVRLMPEVPAHMEECI